MAVKSAHVAIPSPLFGVIFRPVVKVEFQIQTTGEWLELPMIVDTGADYTMLPRWLAKNLRVDLDQYCEKRSTLGIGGTETVFLQRKMTVRLGRWVGDVPIGFVNRDDIPALLGRQDFSEKFRVVLENHTTTFSAPRASRRAAR